MAEIKEATTLEAVPSDIVVMDKDTGKKMILLSLTSTDDDDYFIGVDKNGDLYDEVWRGVIRRLTFEPIP